MLAEQACRLNPNFWLAWYSRGWIRIFLRPAKIAIEHLETAFGIESVRPVRFQSARSQCVCALFQRALRPGVPISRTRDAHANERLDRDAGCLGKPRICWPAHQSSAVNGSGARVEFRTSVIRILKDLINLNRARDFERWIEGLYKSGLPATTSQFLVDRLK